MDNKHNSKAFDWTLLKESILPQGSLVDDRPNISSPFFGNRDKMSTFLEMTPILEYFCRGRKTPFIIVNI